MTNPPQILSVVIEWHADKVRAKALVPRHWSEQSGWKNNWCEACLCDHSSRDEARQSALDKLAECLKSYIIFTTLELKHCKSGSPILNKQGHVAGTLWGVSDKCTQEDNNRLAEMARKEVERAFQTVTETTVENKK